MAQRSPQQNAALYKYFTLVADKLNELGVSPQEFVRDDMPLMWSWKAVRAHFSGLFSDDFKEMPKKHQKAACKAIARTFNAVGIDMRAQLPESADLVWDKDLVKENIWRPVQTALLEKYSTASMNRSEVTRVYKMVAARLAQKYGVDIAFPNNPDKEDKPMKHETAEEMRESLPDDVYEIDGKPAF